MSAAAVHVILVIPRGLSYVMVLSVNSDSREDFWQNNIHLDDTHIAVDTVTWWLQYLNHSINFFVYVLAIKKFRFSS